MHESQREEKYIVDRYKLWQQWRPNYAYKYAKGARIARVLNDVGGLPPLALELGVGPGGVAAQLSRTGMKVLGIDLSPDALAKAKEHCKADDVRLLRASGFSLPFRDESLELIYSSQVLHLFDSPGRVAIMKEARRVLKRGGRFVFDMKNRSSHPARYLRSSPERRQRNFPSAAQIRGLLADAGFSSVVTRPGLLPVVRWAHVPNSWIFRKLAHTTFFVAVRP